MLAAGCQSDTTVVEVGELAYDGQTPIVHVPASASVGSEVVISVTTEGGGCQALDSTDVEVSSGGVDITPYDRRLIPAGRYCTKQLLLFEHQASVTFVSPGMQTVVIHVREADPTPPPVSYHMLDLPYQVAVQ